MTAVPSLRCSRTLVAALASWMLVASAQELPPPPERPSGWIDKKPVVSRRFMVAAANPLAVNAGYSMLLQGGSAADAAIAVQLVLGLVEAQSSGIGGPTEPPPPRPRGLRRG